MTPEEVAASYDGAGDDASYDGAGDDPDEDYDHELDPDVHNPDPESEH
jgi:hypothetical protein